MSQQRIKGQEVKIIIMAGGNLQAELTDIQNFNVTLKLEQLEQGYLGQTTDQHDEIFKGAKVDFEMHSHSQDWITFAQAVMDRARRKTPDTVFNIIAELQYPNGQTPIITLPDVKFGEMPFQLGSRSDYGKIKVDGACDEPDLQTS